MRILALSTFGLCSCLALVSTAIKGGTPDSSASSQHIAWVAESLEQMQAVKQGMTRANLLQVFTTEGGFSTRHSRTYVYWECPYFKVDVEFDAVGAPASHTEGRISQGESSDDRIKKISRPYLQLIVSD